jgi:3-methylcrotonyl-CoA carboxylase alpha subunit
MTRPSNVTKIADGVYRVEHEGRSETVYVAGTATDSWAFWNGLVFRGTQAAAAPRARSAAHGQGAQALAAPMPATVIKVLATAGAHVKKGDTLVVLEAMKMELPIRATGDAVVTAVHCSEGDLVQADAVLVELR